MLLYAHQMVYVPTALGPSAQVYVSSKPRRGKRLEEFYTSRLVRHDAVDISITFAREKCVAFSVCSTIRNKRQTYFFNLSGKEHA